MKKRHRFSSFLKTISRCTHEYRLLAAILAAVLFLGSVSAVGEQATEKKKVTVMIYMCGADLESGNSLA